MSCETLECKPAKWFCQGNNVPAVNFVCAKTRSGRVFPDERHVLRLQTPFFAEVTKK
jgi:hypothetical protein